MRLVMVCPYALDRWGGVQQQAIELAGRLRALGHEVLLIGPGSAGPDQALLLGPTVGIPFNRSVAPVSLRPASLRRVRRAVAGADIVHIQEPLVPVVSLGALISSEAPMVGTFHAAPGPALALGARLASSRLGRWLRRLEAATAVSEVAASVPRRLGLHPSIVPNGLDVARYRLEGERLPHRVAYLGRDEPRKGLEILLRAWPSIRRSIPSAELVVIGARRDRVPAGVRFLGEVDEQTKLAELARAAVLAAPNTGRESFGLIVAEGMAAGCAVVASDLPGFREVVGEAGHLVPPGDADRLAAAIAGLLSEGERIHQLSMLGRARARRFDWETVVPRYMEIYREAMA